MPEYPGYGIYRMTVGKKKPVKCSAEQILEDALIVFNYFTAKLEHYSRVNTESVAAIDAVARSAPISEGQNNEVAASVS